MTNLTAVLMCLFVMKYISCVCTFTEWFNIDFNVSTFKYIFLAAAFLIVLHSVEAVEHSENLNNKVRPSTHAGDCGRERSLIVSST